jgi:hypothetical protein
MTAYTFSQLIDFTRTTSATYVNASGVVTTTPASVNLLLYTQEFDNAAWIKSNTTVTANATTSPDGTTSADKLAETSAVGFHPIQQTSPSVPATTPITWSVYVKAAERTWIYVQMGAGGGMAADRFAYFNLASGVVGTTQANTTATITAAGNGWYRCAITATSDADGGTILAQLLTTFDGSALSYAGVAGSGVYIWGAQLEVGSAPSTYTKNVGGFFPPRFDYNPVTLAPLGLLVEEQRTNSFTQSEFANGVTDAPTRGGLVSATTFSGLIGTTGLAFGHDGTTTSFAYKDGSVNGTTYAISAFVRMDDGNAPVFSSSTLSDATNTFAFVVGGTGINPTTYVVTNFGGGLYRVAATGTSGAATTNSGIVKYNTNNNRTFKVSGYVLEAGTFATSYIRTVASTVTRTADQAVIAAPMFAPWFSQPEGTFVAEFDCVLPATTGGLNKTVFAASDNSTSNRVFQYIPDSGAPTVRISSGGATQATIATTAISSNTVAKSATAYKVNDFVLVSNGGTPATDTSGSVPIGVDRMEIGSFLTANFLNGHIRSINYYPLRLTNAQLQGLTT